MKNYRSLDAHNFFISGWVQVVYHHKPTNSDCVVFKTDVKPSWRVTDPSHHTWVAVRSNGTVVAAHCDCMAGLGETYSHVGAVLFKLEASVRLGFNKVACTDLACQWNKGASCDGYVMCDCCGPGVVEAKCPFNWGQDMGSSLDQWLNDLRGHLQSATVLKNNHPYFTQAQMEMFVTKSSYCDFITWTPQLCVIFRELEHNPASCSSATIAGTEAGSSGANDKSAVKGKRKGSRKGSGGSEGIMTGTSRAGQEQSDGTSGIIAGTSRGAE
ncbi:hypothetical protein PO909_014611 [Leuciscus waleckii]